MRKTIFLTLTLLTVAVINLNAQCFNDGSVGVHYVQKGETLYKIARNNNITVSELCQMNGISVNSPLGICQKLTVSNITSKSAPISTQPATTKSQPIKSYSAETSKFKSNSPVFTPRTTKSVKNTSYSYAQRLSTSKGTHIAEQGENLADIAKYYGYTLERLAEMNSFSKYLRVEKGMLIIVNDCFFQEGMTESKPKEYEVISESPFTKAEPVVTSKGPEVTQPTTTPQPEPVVTNVEPTVQPTSTPTPTRTMNMYMQSEEMEMVDEINLVRSNPTAYVQHIQDYIDNKIKKGLGFASEAVAKELIAELKKTPSLTILKPTKCIYEAARKHGQDRLGAGSSDHQGTDGSWPWDRVTSACPTMTDGNENLVGGPSSIREAVIILLIDDGIPNRGHRKTMLQADWEYVACYKVGQIGRMPNNWVQKYGK